jgi:glycosyltransferase involved in cell wall biosynthesis
MSAPTPQRVSVTTSTTDAATAGQKVELTILLPCLNEAETIGTCVRRAHDSLRRLGVQGEVLVADNGSTDGSQDLALGAGARLVHISERGYGAALRHGIEAARGRYVLMADADDSYPLENIEQFLRALRSGSDLVMGNRFRGGIEPGAMPALHRYLGNPVLTRLGRLFFKVDIGDFHCGMRAFDRERIRGLRLRTPGMEFASEMVVRAALGRLRITEVPTTLRRDGRSRRPHLRTWRDGWRHLTFLLAFSPRWLLWYPAITLIAVGLLMQIWLSNTSPSVGDVTLGVHTMLGAATATIVGIQAGGLAVLSRANAVALGMLPQSRLERTMERVGPGWLLLAGLLAVVAGLGCFVAAVRTWGEASFGELNAATTMRLPILGMFLVVFGGQMIMLYFVLPLIRLAEQPVLSEAP